MSFGNGIGGPSQPVIPVANLRDTLERIRPHLSQIEAEFHVTSLQIFGSTIREELRAESDIDVLVGYAGATTSDDYFNLKFFLEDLLGRYVDLVTEKGLKAAFREKILQECIRIE